MMMWWGYSEREAPKWKEKEESPDFPGGRVCVYAGGFLTMTWIARHLRKISNRTDKDQDKQNKSSRGNSGWVLRDEEECADGF